MTLEEWIHEEDRRLTNGIDSWNKFQENRELHEKPEEITATTLQREYKNGYLDGSESSL